ncbi:MAG: hypothetical protein JO053_14250 [Acidobacteria bacterium]|nr:hypothetical protein [Acidobacteriota bacterium]
MKRVLRGAPFVLSISVTVRVMVTDLMVFPLAVFSAMVPWSGRSAVAVLQARIRRTDPRAEQGAHEKRPAKQKQSI